MTSGRCLLFSWYYDVCYYYGVCLSSLVGGGVERECRYGSGVCLLGGVELLFDRSIVSWLGLVWLGWADWLG